MELQKDIREFVELLLSENAEFLLVGGYALAVHGAPRFTEDIDFLILVSPENADRIATVIERFGFGDLDLDLEDFLKPDFIIQLDRAPNRIDILTGIDGVEWNEAWKSRLSIELDGFAIPVIGKEMLIQNKLATGRTQDRADAERLQQE
ncbi:MAG: nucleotidyl transferase AbiEii/AbiGii toxin family protein [Verrucomicrobiales bacterium]